MNAPHVPTSQLLRDLDNLKATSQTLPPHFARKCDAHTCELYAGLIATVLLTQNKIAEPQSRLFGLLLASLDLNDAQARLFEEAPKTNQERLSECARLFTEHGLTLSFLVDVAVLLRIAGPLPAEQLQLLSELADFLSVLPADLALVADLAAIILGMEPVQDIPPQFDYTKVNVWSEFLYRPLTAERLVAGPLNGRWKISTPIRTSTGWILENAKLRFEEDGCIDTETAEIDRVKITSCTLEKPIIRFGKNLVVEISSSEINGEYSDSARTTAFTFGNKNNDHNKKQGSEHVSRFFNLKVNTKKARAFLLRNFPAIFNSCQFENCGNPNLIGGAIAAYGFSNDRFHTPYFSVYNSSFSFCIARIGGGIRLSGLGHHYVLGQGQSVINSTQFDTCTSIAYQEEDNFGAIFSDTTDAYYGDCLDGCSFYQTSINLGYCSSRNNQHIKNSEFRESLLTFTSDEIYAYSNKFICTTNEKNTGPVRVYISEHSWWNEYE